MVPQEAELVEHNKWMVALVDLVVHGLWRWRRWWCRCMLLMDQVVLVVQVVLVFKFQQHSDPSCSFIYFGVQDQQRNWFRNWWDLLDQEYWFAGGGGGGASGTSFGAGGAGGGAPGGPLHHQVTWYGGDYILSISGVVNTGGGGGGHDSRPHDPGPGSVVVKEVLVLSSSHIPT